MPEVIPKPLSRKLNLSGWVDYSAFSRLRSDPDEFRYSGIWVWTGGQGAGKTLNMIHTLIEIKQQYPKALIVSNIPLFGVDYIQYRGIDDFNKYRNGVYGIIFVLDEIQTLYSSLKSANMDDAELFVWSQNRKNRRVILGTSQRFTRVAKPIREQTAWHIECGNRIFNLYRYRIYDGYLYDDDGVYTGDRPKWKLYVPGVRGMLSYDTHFVVNPNADPEEV